MTGTPNLPGFCRETASPNSPCDAQSVCMPLMCSSWNCVNCLEYTDVVPPSASSPCCESSPSSRCPQHPEPCSSYRCPQHTDPGSSYRCPQHAEPGSSYRCPQHVKHRGETLGKPHIKNLKKQVKPVLGRGENLIYI